MTGSLNLKIIKSNSRITKMNIQTKIIFVVQKKMLFIPKIIAFSICMYCDKNPVNINLPLTGAILDISTCTTGPQFTSARKC